jgi:pseudouridine kinase
MICIVGALAVDLLIYREQFRKGTSNPASIRFAPGGVGYRIYSHLDTPKMLFTALGSDLFGKWLVENMSQPQWVNPIFLDQYPTACYCALMQSGELLYGAADMSVIERGLSWARLRARLPDLGPRDYLVLEANLAPELVRGLIRHAGNKTRVVFESVSVEKLLRHAENLKNLYLLSGNEEEFRALGDWFAARRSAGWVSEYLVQKQIEQFLVTRGRRGVRLWQREEPKPTDISPARVIETSDTTGAGDALMAAYLEAVAQGAEQPDALSQAVRSVETSIQEGTL